MQAHQLQPGHTIDGLRIADIHIGPCEIVVPGIAGPTVVTADIDELLVVYVATEEAREDARRRNLATSKAAGELVTMVSADIVNLVEAHHSDGPEALHAALAASVEALAAAKQPPVAEAARSYSIFTSAAEVSALGVPVQRARA